VTDQKLQGKSAVITGGGNGIGRAVALNLAAEGAAIVVNDFAKGADGTRAADKVVEEIVKNGGAAVANYDSVADYEGGKCIIGAAVSNFGKVDILVNSAGNFRPRAMVEMSREDWYSVIDVHLTGHFNCCRAAVAEMVKQKSGRIITVSSRGCGGFGPHPSASYNSAKAGILGLTSAMAEEFEEHGITVNAILPSASTDLFPGGRPAMADNMPFTTFLEPQFVAPVIAYLATEEAKHITGRYIYASGGDLCIYSRLLELSGPPDIFIRKIGKWSHDELHQAMSSLVR